MIFIHCSKYSDRAIENCILREADAENSVMFYTRSGNQVMTALEATIYLAELIIQARRHIYG